MKSITCVVVLCAVFVCSEGVKLPSYFSKCKLDDANLNDCIKDNGNKALPEFLKGDATVHVVPLLPLHVNEMFIDVDGNLKINLTNFDLIGLDTGKLEDVRWDKENKKAEFDMRFEKAALIGTYDIAGKILILPITGHGPSNITYVNGLFKLSSDYEIEERGGKAYFNVISNKLTYEVDRAYFQLDNLFNGDKRLGEEMSKFLDENWKEVNGEIGVRVGDALGEVIGTIIKSFLSRVPIVELFD